MSEDKKKFDLDGFNPNLFETPQTKLNQMIMDRALKQKKLQEDDTPDVTKRQYFKPADFKKLQVKFEDMRKYHRALSKFLRVTPNGEGEGAIVKRASERAFEKLQKALNDFTVLWAQSTSGFLGSKDEVKEVYKMLIDESKAITSIANPPTRSQMETVVLALNHTLEWLMAQAFPYSAGSTANAIYPQLAKLEEIQLQSQGLPMALKASNEGRFGKLKDKIPFVRGKTPFEEQKESALPFLPSEGGSE